MKVLKQILVIEDNRDLRDMLEIVLSEEGYDVQTASNGKVALDIIKKNAPDLIMLDLHMPVMNGWEFLEMYREFVSQEIPVYIFTALSSPEISRKARTYKVAQIIEKPFRLSNLLHLLANQFLAQATCSCQPG